MFSIALIWLVCPSVFCFSSHTMPLIPQGLVVAKQEVESDSLVYSPDNFTALPSNDRWKYFGFGRRDSLSTYLLVCKICKHKYKKHKAKFALIESALKEKQRIEKTEKNKIRAAYNERFKKMEMKIRDGSFSAKDYVGEIYESKEYMAYQKVYNKTQVKWISEILNNQHSEIKTVLVKEHARFSLVWLGITSMINEPVIKNRLEIDDKKCLTVAKSKILLTSQSLQEINSIYQDSIESVLKILNERQTQKLENRLGINRDEFGKFLNYRSTKRFARDLLGKKKYWIGYYTKKVKQYDGINGLESLKNELGSNVNVRYHVKEKYPLKRIGNDKSDQAKYQRLVMKNSPINDLNGVEIGRPDFSRRIGLLWELPATEKQHRDVYGALDQWKKKLAKSKSNEERVEINNSLLESLEESLVGIQGRGVFRGVFYANGPVSFFFLPGVKKDFDLTDRQLSLLKSEGQKATVVMKKIITLTVKSEVQALKEHLHSRKIRQLEKLIGMPIEEAAYQRAEYYNLNGHNIIYQSSKISDQKLARFLKNPFRPLVN